MPIDPSIPLQAQGSPDNFGKLMQVAQVQQMGQAQQQKRAEMRDAKRIKEMANRGSGLFMRYQSLKDQGFSEQAAHAAMQEDWQREIGGLASLRDDSGAPLFDQQELGQFGQEFNAGQLGMVLPKLMGADRALDLHFQNQKMKLESDDKAATRKHQSDTLAETRRHNIAVEGAPKAGQRPVSVADPKSSTGFTYQTPEGAVGQPAPAPRAQNNTRYSAKELQAARDKVRTVGVARQQLQNIKDKWEALVGKKGADGKRSGAASAGPFGGGMLPTEAGSNFDAAVDQFRSTITALTRTPGVGAMSDYETRLDQSKMPSRRDYESSTEQKIQALEQFVNSLDAGYADIVGEGAKADGPAPGTEQDILDAADAILNGE
jgi:hypothetical protein